MKNTAELKRLLHDNFLPEGLRYYLWSIYTRKAIDRVHEENRSIYRGIVLDIGGRDRGKFKKPRQHVEKWIFADINKDYHPDIILDITDMSSVSTESIDVISMIQVFTNLDKNNKALNECYRVLKKGGHLVMTATLHQHIQEDPIDYQRWTEKKWIQELTVTGFKIKKMIILGSYFTILADNLKIFIKSLSLPIRFFGYLFLPFLDILVLIDKTNFVKKNEILNKFHAGYFIIVEK